MRKGEKVYFSVLGFLAVALWVLAAYCPYPRGEHLFFLLWEKSALTWAAGCTALLSFSGAVWCAFFAPARRIGRIIPLTCAVLLFAWCFLHTAAGFSEFTTWQEPDRDNPNILRTGVVFTYDAQDYRWRVTAERRSPLFVRVLWMEP